MDRILRFAGSVKRDPAISAWMSERPGALGAIARQWFDVIRERGDDVRELLHDGHPTACVDAAAFAYVNAFTSHVNVGFFRGTALADPMRLLEGTGKYMRHVKLRPDSRIDATALVALIESAYTDMKRRLEAEANRGPSATRSAGLTETESLMLVPMGRDAVLAEVEAMSPAEREHVSADWLARVRASAAEDPWVHGFSLVHRATGTAVGRCGFKGPPDAYGVAEIAYGVDPDHQGKGYATEAAEALAALALADGRVHVVRAHTLPEANASTRVLVKCGFRHVGAVTDPEDGLVWRWEKARPGSPEMRPAR
jgi:RimJ/RimL family protein N-acetyltransferase